MHKIAFAKNTLLSKILTAESANLSKIVERMKNVKKKKTVLLVQICLNSMNKIKNGTGNLHLRHLQEY